MFNYIFKVPFSFLSDCLFFFAWAQKFPIISYIGPDVLHK